MSQYINFSLRHGDEFIPIATFQRPTFLYDIFHNYVPYEKVRAITPDTLKNIRYDIDETIHRINNSILRLQETKEDIIRFNNSFFEKYEAISNIKDDIEEQKEYLHEIEDTKVIVGFLQDMLDEAMFSEEDAKAKIDYTKFLYAGIECYNPSLEDIEADSNDE